MKEKIQTLKDMLTDFNRHDALSLDLTNSEVHAIEFAIQELEKVGWIRVSERMPTREEYSKNNGRFIVTDGNRVYQSLFDIYEKKCFMDVEYKGNSKFEEILDNRVIAWHALPEIYNG